jgi:hypothetical protein
MHGMLVHGQQAELDVIRISDGAAGPMFKHLARRKILQEIAAFPAGYHRHAFASFPKKTGGITPPHFSL